MFFWKYVNYERQERFKIIFIEKYDPTNNLAAIRCKGSTEERKVNKYIWGSNEMLEEESARHVEVKKDGFSPVYNKSEKDVQALLKERKILDCSHQQMQDKCKYDS